MYLFVAITHTVGRLGDEEFLYCGYGGGLERGRSRHIVDTDDGSTDGILSAWRWGELEK